MTEKRRLYRARDGMLLGVCLGFARWRELPVLSVRILFVIFTMISGIIPGLVTYLVAAFLMEPEPQGSPSKNSDDDFYDRLRRTGNSAMHDLQDKVRGFWRDPDLPRSEADSNDQRRSSRVNSVDELQEKMSRLDARLQRMEDKVTRKQFDWDERMKRDK